MKANTTSSPTDSARLTSKGRTRTRTEGIQGPTTRDERPGKAVGQRRSTRSSQTPAVSCLQDPVVAIDAELDALATFPAESGGATPTGLGRDSGGGGENPARVSISGTSRPAGDVLSYTVVITDTEPDALAAFPPELDGTLGGGRGDRDLVERATSGDLREGVCTPGPLPIQLADVPDGWPDDGSLISTSTGVRAVGPTSLLKTPEEAGVMSEQRRLPDGVGSIAIAASQLAAVVRFSLWLVACLGGLLLILLAPNLWSRPAAEPGIEPQALVEKNVPMVSTEIPPSSTRTDVSTQDVDVSLSDKSSASSPTVAVVAPAQLPSGATDRPTPPRSRPLEAPGSTPSPKVFVGELSISSDPLGAAVFIDQQFVGETPLNLPQLRAGSHVLWIERTGHERFTGFVTVRADALTQVDRTLQPEQ